MFTEKSIEILQKYPFFLNKYRNLNRKRSKKSIYLFVISARKEPSGITDSLEGLSAEYSVFNSTFTVVKQSFLMAISKKKFVKLLRYGGVSVGVAVCLITLKAD